MAIKSKDEYISKLSKAFKHAEEQLHDAGKENNLKFFKLNKALKMKEEELEAAKAQLVALKDKQKTDELEAELQEKDEQLTKLLIEIQTKDQLISEANDRNQKFNNEYMMLLEYSQKITKQNENLIATNGNNVRLVMAQKEGELQQAKQENHQLAKFIFALEGKMREYDE